MLRRFTTNYLKSKVIGSARRCGLTQTLFLPRSNCFCGQTSMQCMEIWSSKMDPIMFARELTQTLRWLNFVLKFSSVDTAEFTPAEKEKFEESATLIRQFGDVDDLVEEVGKLRKEFKVLYTEIARESATSSVIGHNEISWNETVEEIQDCLRRYNTVVNQVQDPEWKEIISDQLGYYLHLMYNEHSLSNHQHLFDGFDVQRYFK